MNRRGHDAEEEEEGNDVQEMMGSSGDVQQEHILGEKDDENDDETG